MAFGQVLGKTVRTTFFPSWLTPFCFITLNTDVRLFGCREAEQCFSHFCACHPRLLLPVYALCYLGQHPKFVAGGVVPLPKMQHRECALQLCCSSLLCCSLTCWPPLCIGWCELCMGERQAVTGSMGSSAEWNYLNPLPGNNRLGGQRAATDIAVFKHIHSWYSHAHPSEKETCITWSHWHIISPKKSSTEATVEKRFRYLLLTDTYAVRHVTNEAVIA